jgi:hypothetical protein
MCWEPTVQYNYLERTLSEAAGYSPVKVILRLQFEPEVSLQCPQQNTAGPHV